MEEDVALSLCEFACMKVVVVVAVLFQRAWLVRCTESAVPAAPPPPFDSNGVSFFSPLPKIQKRVTTPGHSGQLIRSVAVSPYGIYTLELLKEPDVGGNAETGSSNPATKPNPRA